jgi:uncharacterized protein (TIGR00251 family)
MINVADHPEGCVLPIRAQPGARKAGVVGEHAGSLKVAVTAPPDGGRANRALVEALVGSLNVKRSQLELVSGETSREKKVLIRGVTRTALLTMLADLLNE